MNIKITVEDAYTFNAGDTVLMIQMKGGIPDPSNTGAVGNDDAIKTLPG